MVDEPGGGIADRHEVTGGRTSRHAASATDTAVLRVVLKVRDGPGGDYWWVGCGGCDRLAGCVYAESVG